ncbi:cupredoxin domain-containing protein [Aromatoleum aromaticum]|uniref:Predicted multicopper oxidase n=1 Tax=Aromatoleum aromaticum (strain DSM 19018 / LMG 30748 / EbN1) TaxID=76114 RepID=Q5P6B5_AROAE|nr:cupredoxin family protein [Aromatoleum aromaticum]NMG54905.1 plastocyanin [Aromatoleum aromaticum]CAI07146.1 predicted multicopper oxidase [Aromatoleum aromaticum EbN1]
MKIRNSFLAAALVTVSLLSGGAAIAHGEATHARNAAPVNKEQQDWGIAGDADAVTRTLRVTMTDQMRFDPDRIQVRLGETIRFVHRNAGKMMHEMVIGTKSALDEHADLMVRFPEMEHDEPWMTHVAPGGSGDIIWTFNRPGEFDFACLIPGHYQAGMVGRIIVSGG